MESAAVRTSAREVVEFCFYDVGLSVASASLDPLYKLRFSLLRGSGRINVEAEHRQLPCTLRYERIPSEFASQITPNAVIYDRGSVRFNDYQHEACWRFTISPAKKARCGRKTRTYLMRSPVLPLGSSRTGEIFTIYAASIASMRSESRSATRRAQSLPERRQEHTLHGDDSAARGADSFR